MTARTVCRFCGGPRVARHRTPALGKGVLVQLTCPPCNITHERRVSVDRTRCACVVCCHARLAVRNIGTHVGLEFRRLRVQRARRAGSPS